MKLPKLKLKKPKISRQQLKTSWKRVPFLMCLAAMFVAIVNFVWSCFFSGSYERMGISNGLVLAAIVLLNIPTYIKMVIDIRRSRKESKRLEVKMIVLETMLEVAERMNQAPAKKTK